MVRNTNFEWLTDPERMGLTVGAIVCALHGRDGPDGHCVRIVADGAKEVMVFFMGMCPVLADRVDHRGDDFRSDQKKPEKGEER